MQISVKTKHALQQHGVKYKQTVLRVCQKILLKVAQQAINLRAVNVQKRITRLSNENITGSYTKNKPENGN